MKKFKIANINLSAGEHKILEKLAAAAELIEPLYEAQKNVKYPGANFYPHDATREELEEAAKKTPAILDPYTIVERNSSGTLIAVPYSKKYKKELAQIAKLLKEAAALTQDKNFKQYLLARADDLPKGNLDVSTIAWLKADASRIGFIIGPSHRYHDKFFLIKRSYTAWVGILDKEHTREIRNFQETILASERRYLPGVKRTKVSKFRIRVEHTFILAGLDADFLFTADNIPTSIDLHIVKKHGMISTIFVPVVEERFENWIFPIYQAIFSEAAQKEQSVEELRNAFLRITAFAEISHSTLRNDDVAVRLSEFLPNLDEVYADILAIKNAGLLFLKGSLTEKELGTIITTEICQGVYYLQAVKKQPQLEFFAVGYALVLDFFLKAGALYKNTNGLAIDFYKASIVVDELSDVFEYYLSLASRKDTKEFLERFHFEEVLEQFNPYLKKLAKKENPKP